VSAAAAVVSFLSVLSMRETINEDLSIFDLEREGDAFAPSTQAGMTGCQP